MEPVPARGGLVLNGRVEAYGPDGEFPGSPAQAAVVAAVAMIGRAAHRRQPQAPVPPAGEAARVEISGGQGMPAGTGNEQVNQHIQTYIENQQPPAVPGQGSVVVGEVPQRAPAFQPRAELVTRLGDIGTPGGVPGVSSGGPGGPALGAHCA